MKALAAGHQTGIGEFAVVYGFNDLLDSPTYVRDHADTFRCQRNLMRAGKGAADYDLCPKSLQKPCSLKWILFRYGQLLAEL